MIRPLAAEYSSSWQSWVFLAECITCISQSASVVPWPVNLNSSLYFKGILLQHTIWSAGPVLREIWNHSVEQLIMFSECFMICYSSQINKNKLLKYFLSVHSVQPIQKYRGKNIHPQIVRKLLGKLLSPFCITDPAYVLNCNPFGFEIDKNI